jgi:membrane fusion protein, multidrug efflux system
MYRAEAERQLAARTRALSELDLAKANHARAQRLIGENAISREEFERLSSADAVAASDLAAANAASRSTSRRFAPMWTARSRWP